MAITARFIPGSGVLTVLGDSLDNTITIGPDPAGAILVNDGFIPIDGGQPTRVLRPAGGEPRTTHRAGKLHLTGHARTGQRWR